MATTITVKGHPLSPDAFCPYAQVPESRHPPTYAYREVLLFYTPSNRHPDQ